MSTAKKLKLSLKRRSAPSAIKSGNGCNSDINQREKTDKGSSPRIIDTSVVASLTPRFCGLTNNGNTCYVNVVIQVLRFCPVLMQRLMEISNGESLDDGSLVEQGPPTPSLSKALYELFASMKSLESGTESNTIVIDPVKFVQIIQNGSMLFEQKIQHDTQELLNYILTTLQSCTTLSTTTTSTSIKTTTSLRITNFFKPVSSSPSVEPQQVSKGVISEIFEGRLQSETKCLICEEISIRSDNFFSISVPVFSCGLTRRCGPVSLYRAITEATSLEGLNNENKYRCDSCRHLTEGQRYSVITRLPSMMIIHLNRFTASTTGNQSSVMIHKIHGNIAIPTTMSFKQWTKQTCNDKDSLYKLQGIILHTGASCGCGHYTAIVDVGGKTRNKKNWLWVWFDDENVTSLSHDQVLQMISPLSNSDSTPYILFYERC